MTAILLQADEVLVKPFGLAKIVDLIHNKLDSPTPHLAPVKERVATILERGSDATIQHWMASVERNEELMALKLNYQERTGHLPLFCWLTLSAACALPPRRKFPIPKRRANTGFCGVRRATPSRW